MKWNRNAKPKGHDPLASWRVRTGTTDALFLELLPGIPTFTEIRVYRRSDVLLGQGEVERRLGPASGRVSLGVTRHFYSRRCRNPVESPGESPVQAGPSRLPRQTPVGPLAGVSGPSHAPAGGRLTSDPAPSARRASQTSRPPDPPRPASEGRRPSQRRETSRRPGVSFLSPVP